MVQLIRSDFPRLQRKGYAICLAFFFLCGFLLGIFAFSCMDSSILPLMRSASVSPVSIVGILCVTILPFLISALAVYISEPWILFAVAFGKAFCFSFLSMAAMLSCGSGGWLVRLFLMFSDLLGLPVLYLYWQRSLCRERSFSPQEAFTVLSLLLFIGSVDYRMISPLLAGLIV